MRTSGIAGVLIDQEIFSEIYPDCRNWPLHYPDISIDFDIVMRTTQTGIDMKTLENIDISKPVQVYRNLNKPGCLFSVRQSGLVRGYVESIVLVDAKFKHATPKQLSEVRTGARQVCQWITGRLSEITLARGDRPVLQVSCDPKTANGFCVDGERIDAAAIVAVSQLGCFAVR